LITRTTSLPFYKQSSKNGRQGSRARQPRAHISSQRKMSARKLHISTIWRRLDTGKTAQIEPRTRPGRGRKKLPVRYESLANGSARACHVTAARLAFIISAYSQQLIAHTSLARSLPACPWSLVVFFSPTPSQLRASER
jgi:hypothetical protein